MKTLIKTAALVVLTAACTAKPAPEKLQAVDFTKVEVNDGFWKPRMETNVNVTIPHALLKCESEGRFDNFRRAAGLEEGRWQGHFGFDDTDVYKTMEGMAFTYNVSHDDALLRQMDSIIALIGAAQCEDGYLYTAKQLDARDYFNPWCCYDKERYDNLSNSHEFYNAGHMYEAAAAHYIATGQRNFLDIALKSADHIYELFGPGKREAIPGRQEIELGLLKLANVTSDQKMERRGLYRNQLPYACA